MRAMNLPGMERLLEVASRHGVPIETGVHGSGSFQKVSPT